MGPDAGQEIGLEFQSHGELVFGLVGQFTVFDSMLMPLRFCT